MSINTGSRKGQQVGKFATECFRNSYVHSKILKVFPIGVVFF